MAKSTSDVSWPEEKTVTLEHVKIRGVSRDCQSLDYIPP